MPDRNDPYSCSDEVSEAEQPEPASHLSLTVVGVALVVWGAGPLVASFLYFGLTMLSAPLVPTEFLELLFVVAVFCAVPMKLMRAIPQSILWTCVAIGVVCYDVWNGNRAAWIWGIGLRSIASTPHEGLDDRATIGLIIAATGLLLIGSNGWGPWILHRLRCVGSSGWAWSRAHAKLALILPLMGLWLLNPTHSNETCLQAAQAAEDLHAYQTAIVFTRLARDIFPEVGLFEPDTIMEYRERLTRRISCLERKSAGEVVDLELPDDGRRDVEKSERCPSWRAAGVR